MEPGPSTWEQGVMPAYFGVFRAAGPEGMGPLGTGHGAYPKAIVGMMPSG